MNLNRKSAVGHFLFYALFVLSWGERGVSSVIQVKSRQFEFDLAYMPALKYRTHQTSGSFLAECDHGED